MTETWIDRSEYVESRAGHVVAFLPATMLGVATVLLVHNGDVWMGFGMAILMITSLLLTALVYPFTPEVKAELMRWFLDA